MKSRKSVILLFILAFSSLNITFAQMDMRTDSVNTILKEVYYWDQKVRRDYDNCQNESDKKKLLEQWTYRDSINQAITLPIIDSIIRNEIIGLSKDSWRACFFVLQHADLNIQLKYMDFVTMYFKKGYIYNYEYLLYVDRVNVGLKKAQPYGSQTAKLPNGKYIVFPVRPKAERDSAFISIGIDPRHVQIKNGVFSASLTVEIEDKDVSSVFNMNKTDSVPEKRTVKQYDPLEIGTDDFGFILIVKQNKPNFNGVLANIKILIGGQIRGITNEVGISLFKIARHDIPKTLNLLYPDGKETEHILQPTTKEQDYLIEGI